MKHHDGAVIFPHFELACCLLACLPLAAYRLLAKPVCSTLDTKVRYKTKNGSTSPVTLALTLSGALTKIEY